MQLKWIASAARVAATALATSIGMFLVAGSVPMAIEVLVILALAGIPVAAGIAILKYRLYDIGWSREAASPRGSAPRRRNSTSPARRPP